MKCIYCGNDRGEDYFCFNCGAPKEYIEPETGAVITKEQVKKDVVKLLEFCNEHYESKVSSNDIMAISLLVNITGETKYIRFVSKIVKNILDDQHAVKEMYTS